MKFYIPAVAAAVIVAALPASCASFDVQKKVKPRARADAGPEIITVPIDTERPPTEIIEKPYYIPQEEYRPPEAKPRGTAAARAAMGGILQPEDYSRAATVYDYDQDWVYEVYCQPMRATDIRLKSGEKITEPPFISDSERWKVGAGVSYEGGEAVQHVYIKPDVPDLEASLIINTDERAYHLILHSYRNVHMPIVRWRYPGNSLPFNIAKAPEAGAEAGGDGAVLADPRFLSFNYRITYALFNKPRWMPVLAYDDGKRSYIVFPEESLQAELPAVFENRADVVNYRVSRNVIIIDKLIEAVTVKIGKQSVIVRKQKGKA